MKVVIELYNASGCSLDSHMVLIDEGEDADTIITKAVQKCVSEWTLSVGDSIKITEIL